MSRQRKPTLYMGILTSFICVLNKDLDNCMKPEARSQFYKVHFIQTTDHYYPCSNLVQFAEPSIVIRIY